MEIELISLPPEPGEQGYGVPIDRIPGPMHRLVIDGVERPDSAITVRAGAAFHTSIEVDGVRAPRGSRVTRDGVLVAVDLWLDGGP